MLEFATADVVMIRFVVFFPIFFLQLEYTEALLILQWLYNQNICPWAGMSRDSSALHARRTQLSLRGTPTNTFNQCFSIHMICSKVPHF
jgi:hypothetical protein